MGGRDDSGAPQGGIDAAAKARFLEALRDGARREDAAAAAGFSLTGFYGARRRDPAFAAAWKEALAAGPAAERRGRAYETRGEIRIAPANRRPLQRRRRRHVRFDADRQALFLAHFARNADTRAAAAEAGVCEATVDNHRRTDPAFAAAFEEALDSAYVRLEVELLRQRLAALARLRAAIEEADPPDAPALAETAAEFDRVLKLLARRDRKPRAPEGTGTRRRVWSFEAAIALLAARLAALDIPVRPLDPEAARRFEDGGEAA